MLNANEKAEVQKVVSDSLDRAERVWGDHGAMLDSITGTASFEGSAMDSTNESTQSMIPGHRFVSLEKPKAEYFIALMLDIRDSSKHLAQAISSKIARVSQFQRVYYETSALLPAVAKTIGFKNGKVTEYLGDGALALFRVADYEDYREAVYAAHNAAKNCINDTLSMVNDQLKDRYSLPPLVVGVGMAMSPALVTLIGLSGERQARVLGECVYRAAKLSGGENEIIVDKKMRYRWPKKKGGTVRFDEITMKGVDGFKVGSK